MRCSDPQTSRFSTHFEAADQDLHGIKCPDKLWISASTRSGEMVQHVFDCAGGKGDVGDFVTLRNAGRDERFRLVE
jgi:hypothetical protein